MSGGSTSGGGGAGLLGLSYESTTEDDELPLPGEGDANLARGSLVAYDHPADDDEEHEGAGAEGGEGGGGEEEGQGRGEPPVKRPRVGDSRDDTTADDRHPAEGDELQRRRQEQEEEEEEEREQGAHEPQQRQQQQQQYDQVRWPTGNAGRSSLMESMLPPRATHPPDAALQRKIVEFHRLRRQGRAKSINEKIRHARNFKNPYMLNWLVSHCGIDEIGSNYPKDLFDPAAIRREAAEVMERQKRQKQAAAAAQQGRTAIEFAPGEASHPTATAPGLLPPPSVVGAPPVALGVATRPLVKVVEGVKRSKGIASKWDQGDPGRTTAAATASRYAEYALQKKAEIEARLREK